MSEITTYPALINPNAWDSDIYSCTEYMILSLDNSKVSIGTVLGQQPQAVRGLRSKNDGKWYFEIYWDPASYSLSRNLSIGLSDHHLNLRGFATAEDWEPGTDSMSWGLDARTGNVYNNNIPTTYVGMVSLGSVIGCAVDFDAGKIWWSVNGVWGLSGNPATGTNPAFSGLDISGVDLYPTLSVEAYLMQIHLRNYSNYTYTPPSGFQAWDNPPPYEQLVSCTLATIIVKGLMAGIAVLPIECSLAEIVVESKTALFNSLHWGTGATDYNSAAIVFSNDDKTVHKWASGTYVGGRAHKSHSSGKWYFEVKTALINDDPYPAYVVGSIGICPPTKDLSLDQNAMPGLGDDSWGFNLYDGSVSHDCIINSPNPGLTHDYGDPCEFDGYVGCAVDFDAGKIWWSINGVWQANGDPVFGLNAFFQEIWIDAATPQYGLSHEDMSFTISDYSDCHYPPPEGFYYWDYEPPRNESLTICKLATIDLSAYKTIVTNLPGVVEDPGVINTFPANIRVLNFRALIGE